ncbi:STAS domain-containing protein [Amycolatopsis sp. NPDC004169]|uniref:STAS domain-containing protein n=1 Tax=Amycolatopsis sp. NPDC004169 TaxID=3154453 RepID=UPI0033BB3AEA
MSLTFRRPSQGELPHPLGCTHSRNGELLIASVDGEIDMATAPRFVHHVEELLAERRVAVIADLTKVSFLGAAGVVGLLTLTTAAQAADVPFCVVTDQRAVLRPLQVTAVDRVVVVHATFERAHAWLNDQT